ncbi:MAG TPA: HAMP domain-containing sensor histidine kinase, partial [Albitalea sp.]
LAGVARDSGGLAFVADAQGRLLATSGPARAPPRHGEPAQEPRTRVEDSGDPILSAVGQAIRRAGRADGSTFLEIEGERHLARWWTHALHNGPRLTMGVALPESRFDTPMRGVLRNIVVLTLAIMAASVLLAVYVAHRVVRPLSALNDWADRLARGDWQAQAPGSSPIRELRVLSDAMDAMAGHLKQHSQQLEHVVAQRTAALQQALASVEQTLTDQRHFIAMLSHEVRSPLAVIHSAAQLLELRAKGSPSQLAAVERVLRGSARLKDFFDNCLTQDRMDSENFALQPAPIEVRAMVAGVVDHAAQLSGKHPLEASVAADLPTLHGDAVLLRVMLVNLLSNAFKYSPAGAPVRLRVWRRDAHCCFAVEDRGGGIAPDESAAIFEKYRRGRAAEGKPGAGLGLALVQRIAALHGGTVALANRRSGGCRFTVEVPFQPPAAQAPSARTDPRVRPYE